VRWHLFTRCEDATVKGGIGRAAGSTVLALFHSNNNPPALIFHPRSYAMSPASLRLLGWLNQPQIQRMIQSGCWLAPGAAQTQQRLGYYNGIQCGNPTNRRVSSFKRKIYRTIQAILRGGGGSGYYKIIVEGIRNKISVESSKHRSCRIWRNDGRDIAHACITSADRAGGVTVPNGAAAKVSTKLLVAADARRQLRSAATACLINHQALTGRAAHVYRSVEYTPTEDGPFSGFRMGCRHCCPRGVPIMRWSYGYHTEGTVQQWKTIPLVSHVNSVLQQGPGQLPYRLMLLLPASFCPVCGTVWTS
jgi:hypothetical protein